MKEFTSRIIEVKHETHDVHSIKLEKNDIDFKPGQYMIVELDVDDPEGSNRPLSIASSPTEDFLMFSTRERQTPFKKQFHNMKVGEKLKMKGPIGIFTLKEDAKEIVFLSGGIGVTPFRSMIKYATDKKLPMKMTLLFSNKTANDVIYKDDWEQMQNQNSNFKVVQMITDDINWTGRKGRINESLIREFINDINNALFYICGPPLMVSTLQELLMTINVPAQNIKREMFSGY